jgi:hypothetical protein
MMGFPVVLFAMVAQVAADDRNVSLVPGPKCHELGSFQICYEGSVVTLLDAHRMLVC